MVPKAPAVSGWASPGYVGVSPDMHTTQGLWLGLRCDNLVVVDCDTDEAAKFWLARYNPGRNRRTYVRKTPRGFHFVYTWTEGSPTGPAVGVFPHVDIRAGRGSQIVFTPLATGTSDKRRGTTYSRSTLGGFPPARPAPSTTTARVGPRCHAAVATSP